MNERTDYVEKAINVFLGIGGGIALVVCNLAVLSRVMQFPLAWTDEVLRGLFSWLFFIGCAVAYKRGGCIGITLLEEFMEKKSVVAYKALKILQHLIVAFFAGFCAVQGAIITFTKFTIGEITTVLEMPAGILNMGYAIGMALLCGYGLYLLYGIAKKTMPLRTDETLDAQEIIRKSNSI